MREYTPFLWEYWPLSMEARLGVQMEFVQKQLFSITPSVAMRSMLEVGHISLR
jgi:hypothetical protein